LVDESLARRVGRLAGEQRGAISHRASYDARGYLLFLGLRGHARLDYPWMLASGHLYTCELASQLGFEFGLQGLIDDAVRLKFERGGADQGLRWTLGRILLYTTHSTPAAITDEHIDELLEAVRRFGERPDIAAFHGSRERYRGRAKTWTTHIHRLGVVLFHRGQLKTQPRKLMPSYADRPPVPARMQASVDRWLAARRLTDRPVTVAKLELTLRRFMVWLTQTEPALESFAAVTRDHALGYLTAMAEDPNPRTGRPLSARSRIGRTSALSMFFRDTAAWQWPDVPGHALLGAGDQPKAPTRVLPAGCAELAQERELLQLPDDLCRTRRPRLPPQPHQPADTQAHVGHAQRIKRPPRLRVEHRLKAPVGLALRARPCGGNEPLERRDPRAQQLAVAERDRRGPQQRQRRIVLQGVLDEESLDVVDVARIGVAEVRQLCRALAVLARGALGRVVRRELPHLNIELGREPLHAGARGVLQLGRDEPKPSTRQRSLSGSATNTSRTRGYLHGDLALKQRALDRVAPPHTTPGRYGLWASHGRSLIT
jgi:hypothetical protein